MQYSTVQYQSSRWIRIRIDGFWMKRKKQTNKYIYEYVYILYIYPNTKLIFKQNQLCFFNRNLFKWQRLFLLQLFVIWTWNNSSNTILVSGNHNLLVVYIFNKWPKYLLPTSSDVNIKEIGRQYLKIYFLFWKINLDVMEFWDICFLLQFIKIDKLGRKLLNLVVYKYESCPLFI